MFNVCNLCDKPFPSKSKLDRHLNSKTKCIDRINTENAKKKVKKNMVKDLVMTNLYM
jgi:hypothetical protein